MYVLVAYVNLKLRIALDLAGIRRRWILCLVGVVDGVGAGVADVLHARCLLPVPVIERNGFAGDCERALGLQQPTHTLEMCVPSFLCTLAQGMQRKIPSE